MEIIYVEIERRRNILSHADFSYMCDVIKSFTPLEHNIGKEYMNFLFLQVQE